MQVVLRYAHHGVLAHEQFGGNLAGAEVRAALTLRAYQFAHVVDGLCRTSTPRSSADNSLMHS